LGQGLYRVVGVCLAAARRPANVTPQELAGRLAKPQSFVSEYERGQRRVDVVELLVISRALKGTSASAISRWPSGTVPITILTEPS